MQCWVVCWCVASLLDKTSGSTLEAILKSSFRKKEIKWMTDVKFSSINVKAPGADVNIRVILRNKKKRPAYWTRSMIVSYHRFTIRLAISRRGKKSSSWRRPAVFVGTFLSIVQDRSRKNKESRQTIRNFQYSPLVVSHVSRILIDISASVLL